MESHGLRDTALGELAKTEFYPAAGQKRLTSMIAQRPDWRLSRQRAGVPLTIFVNKQTGDPLRDPAVHARILEAMRTEGADCCSCLTPAAFWATTITLMIMNK